MDDEQDIPLHGKKWQRVVLLEQFVTAFDNSRAYTSRIPRYTSSSATLTTAWNLHGLCHHTLPVKRENESKKSIKECQQSMCGLTDTIKTLGGNQIQAERYQAASALRLDEKNVNLPVETFLEPPSLLARYTCASIMVAIFAVWGNYTFVGESQSPGVTTEVHSYKIPVMLTAGYLISLQILKIFAREYLSEKVDMKLLLMESMILYNMGQVALNAWMVYKFLSALYHGHPIVGDIHAKGATYAVWVHYCDKYLEFFDTYFMVLRGKMDQVSLIICLLGGVQQ